MLTLALVTAAFLAGLSGAWSPCGFSMVETLGASAARRTAALLAGATFAAGAVAGGVATFGSLALAGELVHGAGGELAAIAAGAIALAAGAGEARGVRIVPQIRRQVPEPWRRVLPLPVAAALYGVLLGLGFTTFVLTLGVWALAAISFALGEPSLGLTIGLAFGAGRALPVAALAPVVDRELGIRLSAAMAERPGLLRGFRLADAIALGGCATALFAARASAATVVATGASDPTIAGGLLAWDGTAGGVLHHAGPTERQGGTGHHLDASNAGVPGTDPALGGSLLAWKTADVITVVRAADFAAVTQLSVPGVDALAVSDSWLVYRIRSAKGDRIAARAFATPTEERTIASARPPAQLGRPALDGGVAVFHAAGLSGSRIVQVELARRKSLTLRSSRVDQLTNPAILGGALLYVRESSLAQQLELGPRRRRARDRVLLRRNTVGRRDNGFEPGHSSFTRTPRARPPAQRLFWTTALSRQDAYLTLVPTRGDPRLATIVRMAR